MGLSWEFIVEGFLVWNILSFSLSISLSLSLRDPGNTKRFKNKCDANMEE
jgi:hypothetical protein